MDNNSEGVITVTIHILKYAQPQPRLDYTVDEVIQVGKPGNLETILEILKLNPNQLYLCCGQKLDGMAVFAGNSKKPSAHWARVREQFKRQMIEPDAFVIRYRKSHRRIYAWWGSTFQNALSMMSLFRGMKALEVLRIFDAVNDPSRFKDLLFPEENEPLMLSRQELIEMGWAPPAQRVG